MGGYLFVIKYHNSLSNLNSTFQLHLIQYFDIQVDKIKLKFILMRRALEMLV